MVEDPFRNAVVDCAVIADGLFGLYPVESPCPLLTLVEVTVAGVTLLFPDGELEGLNEA